MQSEQIVQISSPKGMRSERDYIYRLVFQVFLGLRYQVQYSSTDEVVLIFHSRKISFPDVFFQSQKNSWLTDKYLEVLDANWSLNAPAWSTLTELYGLFASGTAKVSHTEAILETEEEYRFNFDLFGSIFFLISRYEEHVIEARDIHRRFEFSNSMLFQSGLISRPLVNEYVHLLKETLARSSPETKFREHRFRQHITCDIDFLRFPAVSGRLTKPVYFFWQILKGAGVIKCLRGFAEYCKATIGGYRFDSFNQFKLIADQAEKTNSMVVFYLMSGINRTNQDGDYQLEELEKTGVVSTIIAHNIEVGLHGGYENFEDSNLLTEEKQTIEEFISQYWEITLNSSRQHYLRWTPGLTAEALERAGLTIDSTLGFAEHVGFRSSCCYEYPIFSLIERRELSLIERPLMVMDVTLLNERYMGFNSAKEAIQAANIIKAQVIKYGGIFTILWHNSSLSSSLEREVFFEITESTPE